MTAYNKFIMNNFITDKGIIFLPLKQYGDKMIGTKNNLTLKELKEVHADGFITQNNNKVYRMVDKKDMAYFELRLKIYG